MNVVEGLFKLCNDVGLEERCDPARAVGSNRSALASPCATEFVKLPHGRRGGESSGLVNA